MNNECIYKQKDDYKVTKISCSLSPETIKDTVWLLLTRGFTVRVRGDNILAWRGSRTFGYELEGNCENHIYGRRMTEAGNEEVCIICGKDRLGNKI